MTSTIGKVALLWRGDREARRTATRETSRFNRVFEALAACNVHAEPVVYADDVVDEVRAQLLAVDGVLVWVNPIQDGANRVHLDALLRDVASRGVWVSAHPDVILKMGVKEVLHRTRHLGWGTDTQLYRSAAGLRAALPGRLAAGPRVIKRNRGDGGQGVWKVEAAGSARGALTLRVLEATRGSLPEELALDDFMARCAAYFAEDGAVIEQPFVSPVPDGMVRVYMGVDRVVGFGHQHVKALVGPESPGAPAPQSAPRLYHPNTLPRFQAVRRLMESEWTPQLMDVLGIARDALPLIWDADFLYGPRTPDGQDTYVLCEINVSSVFPIPDQAPAEISKLVAARLTRDKPARAARAPARAD
jgi:hypothetical protein